MHKKLPEKIVSFSLDRPQIIVWVLVMSTLLFITLATLPSLWPQQFPALHSLKIDTDPENMLSETEPIRIFHNQAKQEFSLHDIVVVGVVNETHSNGVFNTASLTRIFNLTEFARQLNWPDSQNPDQWEGVIEVDMIAPSMVDNIEQGGLGTVKFSWLMPQPPTNEEDAIAIRDRAARIPFLHDTLVSADGKAIALYLPLTSKDVSYEVRKALLEYVADWEYTGDQVYITGLPVAEDTFGVEMFVQMAVSAPLAMLVIFFLLWWFFRNFMLIISPMVVALVCSLSTMALLVISGNTVHIMSSMIPIFIMPIAVLDSVHILSEFFDRYPQIKDRRRTIEQVMQHLFQPMLFTTLTTIAGFASLALTPIPPVQVFGIFIAFGVFLAWFWTIIFIPAFIMLMPEHKLADFGHTRNDAGNVSLMNKILQRTGKLTYQHARKIISGTVLLALIAIWGISLIQVNDNPVKWFVDSHPIRVADRVLNEHFGGTYMAYLQFEQSADNEPIMEYEQALKQRLVARKIKAIQNNYYSAASIFGQIIAITTSESFAALSGDALLTKLSTIAETSLDAASDEEYDTWDDVLLFLDQERQRSEIFKKPEVLGYLDSLQQHLSKNDIVGKSNSVVDVVKTVHRELLLGKDEAFRIPETTNAVAQTLVTYQNSHRPQDLWHFVTPDYRKAVLWLQLNSGDNRDMETVINDVEAFVIDNPPPFGLEPHWFGLTYINTVWQDKMVSGMMEAFMGSFLIVLMMMVFLFRSLLWGLLSMIPLTVTVGMIYGIIGIAGKNYDMPVAVLSSLSLGLAIDYAIHFLARSRELRKNHTSWRETIPQMFGEPARAITRNAIILGAGFLPLLAAPLVPYQTVGVFIAAIIGLAGIASLMILPAAIRILEERLF
jgi:uncharacterized protein